MCGIRRWVVFVHVWRNISNWEKFNFPNENIRKTYSISFVHEISFKGTDLYCRRNRKIYMVDTMIKRDSSTDVHYQDNNRCKVPNSRFRLIV